MAPTSNTVGANAERARSHNKQMVLDRVRQAGQIGRAEIARTAGLSTQAVSNIISDLLSEGLLAEQGRKATTRGQPPVQYALNPHGGFAVGIEIRPDAIFSTVLDLCGKPMASARSALPATDLGSVTNSVVAAKASIMERAEISKEKLLGVGIVMPGPFGPTGLSGAGSEFSIFHDLSPTAWFTEALGLPVVVENDANAAAVAERLSGVASHLQSFAFLYFGKGLGLGVVQSGRLIRGAVGNAGEIGHVPVPMAGETVALERVLSRLSVQNHLAKAGLAVSTSSELAGFFDRKDPILMEWLDSAAVALSDATAIIENLLDPETIILGGAMPDTLIDHLIASATLADRSVANRPTRSAPRLMRGTCGHMAGSLGAGALVIHRAFTPRITATV